MNNEWSLITKLCTIITQNTVSSKKTHLVSTSLEYNFVLHVFPLRIILFLNQNALQREQRNLHSRHHPFIWQQRQNQAPNIISTAGYNQRKYPHDNIQPMSQVFYLQ